LGGVAKKTTMTNNTEIIRATLRQNDDGLTLNQIAVKSGVAYRSVHRMVTKMPDVYIDRWQTPTGAYPYQAVWCVVVVPQNCPHPKGKT
jgi:hypothetical protein